MQVSPLLKTITDQDGNYRITGIPPGNCQVLPIAPLYVQPDLTIGRGGKMLILSAGENVQGIDFSLERGGVITGKVTDADGRPVIEERITISPEGQTKSRGEQMPFAGLGRFVTDDRGIYRIYGVPEGRYRVAVGQADDDSYFDPRPGRVAYKRPYYPDTTDPDNAKIVVVPEGGELSNIDITLGRSLPSFSASGKVVDGENGEPIVGMMFVAQRMFKDGNSAQVASMSSSNSQGEFRIDNVTPGKYLVIAAPLPGSEVRTEGAPFEVTDQDVTGLLIKTFKGLSISGTIVVEGVTDKNILSKVAELRLQAYSHDDSNNPGGRDAVIGPDGSFRIVGLTPGNLNFYLSTKNYSPPKDFSVTRIERDGVVQSHNLSIKPGENLTGITVILAYGTGAVRGEVKVENGPLPQGARFAIGIRKAGAGDTGDPASSAKAYNVDVRGHFLIEGVVAGTYELYVTVNVPERRSLPSVKQLITVSEAVTTDVDVTVDLKSNPDQQPQP
ncbi:MAG TPA: carboxypeptidase regulatory-like domain-containing protein [Pyrinomonadaceae bacterium]|nr:carboxypeptidase regulatory-like domain-containing protein [Pyrinomonadaceae bacterium]